MENTKFFYNVDGKHIINGQLRGEGFGFLSLASYIMGAGGGEQCIIPGLSVLVAILPHSQNYQHNYQDINQSQPCHCACQSVQLEWLLSFAYQIFDILLGHTQILPQMNVHSGMGVCRAVAPWSRNFLQHSTKLSKVSAPAAVTCLPSLQMISFLFLQLSPLSSTTHFLLPASLLAQCTYAWTCMTDFPLGPRDTFHCWCALT